ncbi:hypothetical protein FIBSPDRAFT_962882 [Athelia psychrophila]|uniref:DUF6533 domain-containing protein n=1 Tax=Athelia psychrophila TaxID=1759441 RepID=A0A165ZKI6_9AGAM|nr:hypothetical protein FIBSPDRAFT_962882 [Fibularhizoctonia sp. CBS 109695]
MHDPTDVIVQLQQTQAAHYIAVCALTAVLWDWILSLADEYRIVKRCGASTAVFACFLARSSAVISCVLTLIFSMGIPSHDSCSGIFNGIGTMTAIGSASKAYLFLLRVRAVYGGSKLATVCVVTGGLAVVLTRIVGTSMVHTSPLGNTRICGVTNVVLLPVISLWLNVAYDTFIFVSISVRLISHTTSTTNYGILWFVRGHGLPRTMRHLLQDGQLYYFVTLIFMLLAAVMAGDIRVGPILQVIFTVPSGVVETILTCKVFRDMILRSLDTGLTSGAKTSTYTGTYGTSTGERDQSLEMQTRMTHRNSEQA